MEGAAMQTVEKSPSSDDARPPLDPSKTREEGELSSDDDDDENPISSVALSSAILATSSGAMPVPPMNKSTQAVQPGKAVCENNPASSADNQSQPSIQPTSQRINDENQMPLKSATPGWRAPPRGNSNLVISFSDDDSHSDSEEKDHRKEKSRETKSHVTGVVFNGKPPTSSFVRPNKLRQTASNVDKAVPKKFPMSRTFIPSMTKAGGVNFREAVPSSADQLSRVRTFNYTNRNVVNRERVSDQGVRLNTSELQDLRQQIALRESELKLKSAQRTKESVTSRVDNSVGPDTDGASKSIVRYSDVVQTEPKEPDKKRLRAGSTFSTQLSVLGPKDIPVAKSVLSSKVPAVEELSAPGPKGLPLTKSAVSSKVPVVENNSQLGTVKISHGQKGIPVGPTELSIVKGKTQNDKHDAGISQNIHSGVKNGAGTDTILFQSDRRSKQVDTNVALKLGFPTSMEFNHTNKSGGHLEPGSFLNNSSGGKNLMRSADKKLDSCSIYQASLNNASLWNGVGNANFAGNDEMNIHSWVEMEETLDMDLEEAQENRRRCEIEERNALKAYRKAQRDLLEANARCSELYRIREQYSANMRSYMMDNPSLIWSSRQNEPVGTGLDNPSNVSENLNLIPTSSHQMHPEYNGLNPAPCDSSVQCVNSAPIRTSYNQLNGKNIGPEPCTELDASTSEPVPLLGNNARDGVSSPSNEPNNSADEDEGRFSFENESVQHDLFHKHTEFGEKQKDIDQGSNRKMSSDGSQDPVLLERMLRSKLFATLGPKNLSKNSIPHSETELAVERGAENDVRSEKAQEIEGSFPFSEVEKDHQSDHEGTDGQGKSSSEGPLEILREHSVENVSVNSQSNSYTDDRFYFKGHQGLTSVMFSPSNILRSAIAYMKVTCPKRLTQHQDQSQRSETCINSEKVKFSSSIVDPLEETLIKLSGREVGSYTTGPGVDPFWPHCMYELRGKCNNDVCPWQHVKDYPNTNRHQQQNDTSDSTDCQVGLTFDRKKWYHNAMTLPTYLVGFRVLKADPHSYKSVLARRDSQCWKKCFSLFLVLSDLFQKDVPADSHFFYGNDSRIKVPVSWSRQSTCFQSRDGGVNQLTQALGDNDQYLETALLLFSQEANELEGMRKALPVLSGAVEADPKSIVAWIFYLLIFYSHVKSVGKDDMFSCAVKYNDRSYELWLMYINSRMQLDDKLVMYDVALSALAHHAPASDIDGLHASACILDLSLQMLQCLCMSGNVEKAIKKIFGLFPAAMDFDEPNSLLPPDIFTCLTIYDKCIFGVCCVYLVVYRTLPDVVVRQFECQKELFEIEWPSIQLTDDEKQRAILLMETIVDSVDSHLRSESVVKSEYNLRLEHFLALNHLRCMAALDSLEICRNLLEKYLTLYPSCLELVLISVRAHEHDLEDSVFERFEDALSNWPKGVPGIQCIWNQYVEYALQSGRFDFGKEILDRWFSSAWKVHYLQNGTSDDMKCDHSDGSLGLGSDSIQQSVSSNSKQMDGMFGHLNLSLYKLLQNDHIEGRLALDRALSVAVPQYFKYCIREHAFMFTDESLIKENACISDIQKILERYLGEAQAFRTSEPLSRKFMNDIKKPRVRQLASNVFSPLSHDFPLVNAVLEVWYGPSLLPQNFSEQKYLVDFVEAIMDITPSNHQLAFSVCKRLSSGGNASDASFVSVLFWASSQLVSAIFEAVPVPPECVWVEAAEILGNMPGVEVISERFYRRAFSVYPFSVKLWKSYSILSRKTTGNADTVVEAAKEKGIELG